MKIDVRRIAEQAMLELPEEQAEALEREFAAFIEMAQCLPEPEEADKCFAPEEMMLLREDAIVLSYPREAMLQNAPQTSAGCIAASKAFKTDETGVAAR